MIKAFDYLCVVFITHTTPPRNSTYSRIEKAYMTIPQVMLILKFLNKRRCYVCLMKTITTLMLW